jgi:hypothetical protein
MEASNALPSGGPNIHLDRSIKRSCQRGTSHTFRWKHQTLFPVGDLVYIHLDGSMKHSSQRNTSPTFRRWTEALNALSSEGPGIHLDSSIYSGVKSYYYIAYALLRKFKTNIPRNETVCPRSHFYIHVSVRFM